MVAAGFVPCLPDPRVTALSRVSESGRGRGMEDKPRNGWTVWWEISSRVDGRATQRQNRWRRDLVSCS